MVGIFHPNLKKISKREPKSSPHKKRGFDRYGQPSIYNRFKSYPEKGQIIIAI
jgi:hypothetical protein